MSPFSDKVNLIWDLADTLRGPYRPPEYPRSCPQDSFQARFQIEREATGTSGSMLNVGQDTLQNLVISLPPEVVQADICRYIEAETRDIDNSSLRIHATIALLREYHAALISAAVTGQLDIRKHEKQLDALA